MSMLILTVAIRYEQDVVLARQRARQLAGMLGFDHNEEVRIATAVSEIARNAYQYSKNGKAEYWYDEDPPRLRVRLVDEGPGIPRLQDILDGRYQSNTGLGLGILGARRLMDDFEIASKPGKGTQVVLSKYLPKNVPPFSSHDISRMAERLIKETSYDPFTELQRQNQELLAALDQLSIRQKQLTMLNKELEDTNRGVVALYAELDERAEALRRTADLKTQFLSNMSHEFRTPLNSILSLSHILLEQTDGVLTEEQLKQVRFIEKAAAGLSELVNDLLDLARAEAGKVQIRPSQFTVEAVFGALRGMLRPLLANNSVQLVFEEPEEGFPTLYTDENKVSQVLRNFISNALKFTERGEVRVSARLGPKGYVMFSVADTGIGIDPADQTRIFEEYVQVEGPHQMGKRGTGLGLPLSKQLAHLLGGNLSLHSVPGVGSTFSLTIPTAYSGPAVVTYGPEVIRDVDRTRLPVLVVEDNLETQFIYEKLLRGTGFQPIPVKTVQEARRALDELRPVAVLLDILLNSENTWEFLSELKTDPSTKTIPVYVVTMVDNQQKALALGADDFHAKPLDRIWLLNKLQQLETTRHRPDLLVIDDDEVSRYLLKGHLSDTFSRVLEASSGMEGLRMARERHPAAIFLDLMMPDLDGFAVLEKLKADKSTKDIPVIVHSARHLTEQEKERLNREATAVVPKNPAEREATLLQIRKALQQAAVVMDKREGVDHGK